MNQAVRDCFEQPAQRLNFGYPVDARAVIVWQESQDRCHDTCATDTFGNNILDSFGQFW